MNPWRYAVLVILLALAGGPLQAAIETYEFKDEATREAFSGLAERLRCPKCQNESLASSDAPIANDMRDRVYEMLQEGQSPESIVDYMVARYGDFVNYIPRRDETTWVLWYGPVVLLILGGLVVVAIARHRRRPSPAPDEGVDKERLQRLLHKTQGEDKRKDDES